MNADQEAWQKNAEALACAKPDLELRAPQQRQYPYLIFLLPPSAGWRPSELINEACDLLWLIFFFPSVKLVLSVWHLSRPWSQEGLFMWLKLRECWSALAGWFVVLAAELNFSTHSLLWSEEADLGSKFAIPCVLLLLLIHLCFYFFPQTLSLQCACFFFHVRSIFESVLWL